MCFGNNRVSCAAYEKERVNSKASCFVHKSIAYSIHHHHRPTSQRQISFSFARTLQFIRLFGRFTVRSDSKNHEKHNTSGNFFSSFALNTCGWRSANNIFFFFFEFNFFMVRPSSISRTQFNPILPFHSRTHSLRLFNHSYICAHVTD